MRGQIISSSCGVFKILTEKGTFEGKSRGVLKNKFGRLYVGDFVDFNVEDSVIESVEERKSFLKRPPISNIDQIVVILSYTKPEFSYELVFKYLTYANMNGIKATLVVTKVDLCENKLELDEIKNTFETLGIKTYFVCNKTGEGLKEVKDIFKGKISCLMGQSGVGKSSLLNAINGDYKRNIGEYSKALGRGKHETKEVVLLPFEGGYIADTPGFSSLELDLFKEDLARYFPGFDDYNKCFFSNCLHVSEKKCAIKDKVESGLIPKKAYETYLFLSNNLLSRNQRFSKWNTLYRLVF